MSPAGNGALVQQLPGSDLTLSEGIRATGAEIIVNFLVGQNEKQSFPYWHGLSAAAAKKTAGAQAFKLSAHVTALNPSSPK